MTNQNRSNLQNTNPTTQLSKDLTGSLPVLINTASVIGRQSDLERLSAALADTTQVALVNGLGGIGKSTLAKLYIAKNYQHFDHIAWLSFTGKSFEDMVISSLLAESLGLDRKTIASDKLLPLIFQKLKDLKGNNLLVIDNADHTEEVSKYRNRLPQGLGNWQVLITSRGVIEGFEQISIDTLSPTDAKTLFLTHYPHAKSETETLEELLNLVGLHTLTIELMAKTLAKSRRLKSVGGLLEKIKDKKYEDSTLLKEVQLEHRDRWSNEEEKRKIKGIYQYLLATFDLAELNGREQWLLKQFAVLPPKPLEVEVFFEWLGLDETNAESAEEVEDTLDSLIAKGWLQESEDKSSVLLHAVLKELVLFKLKPRFEDCKGLIRGFTKFIDVDEHQTIIKNLFKFAGHAESLLQQFNIEDIANVDGFKAIAELHDSLGYLYLFQGNYHQAIQQAIKTLHWTENTPVPPREKDPLIATCYNNLGNAYRHNGDYLQAEKNIKLALKYGLKVFDDNHPEIASFRSNLGSVYLNLKNYSKAKKLFEIALQSDLKNYKQDNHLIAIDQNNLAMAHLNLGNPNQAKNLLESALKNYRKKFGDENHEIASSYINLSLVYQRLGQNKQAIEYAQKSYNMRLNLLGKDHPKTQYASKQLEGLENKEE
jgi:tetratricopeptide (TPR) repeat protein